MRIAVIHTSKRTNGASTIEKSLRERRLARVNMCQYPYDKLSHVRHLFLFNLKGIHASNMFRS